LEKETVEAGGSRLVGGKNTASVENVEANVALEKPVCPNHVDRLESRTARAYVLLASPWQVHRLVLGQSAGIWSRVGKCFAESHVVSQAEASGCQDSVTQAQAQLHKRVPPISSD
jgi:hypothetical protein